jgi:uncharacterized LabA/DUF88 family protein
LKFNAYIDGFNLYKSALEKRPELKWLDLAKYCQSTQPESTLDQVFYFTARIKERFKGDDAPRRQHAYLRALEATGVTIVLGRFTKDCDWLRLNSKEHLESIEPSLLDSDGSIQSAFDHSSAIAEPDSIRANIWKFGEKGSDVNLASYLLMNVLRDGLKEALVVSGDSDLATPIRIAKSAGAIVRVISPSKGSPRVELRGASSFFEELNPNKFLKFQLDDHVQPRKGKLISRPVIWRK